MPNTKTTSIYNKCGITFESSDNIYSSKEFSKTTNLSYDSNYFSFSNQKQEVSIQVNVKADEHKMINKSLNE